MATYYAKVTRRGQVTIPAPVRRELGLQAGDRVEVRVEDGCARVARVGSVTEQTAGVFKAYAIHPPPTAEELREMSISAWAEDAFERDEQSRQS